MIEWILLFGCALLALLAVAGLAHASRLAPSARQRRMAADRAAEIDQARQQSYALGFPFPEQDGTLSRPPARSVAGALGGLTGAEAAAHLQMHLRRLVAESGTGLTAWPATTVGDPDHRPAHASPEPASEYRYPTEPSHAAPDAATGLALAPGVTLQDLLEAGGRQGFVEIDGKRLSAQDVIDLLLSSDSVRRDLRK